MADIGQVAPGLAYSLMDVTLMINQGGAGFSETLHAAVQGNDPYTPVVTAMTEYIQQRKKVLSDSATIEALRVSRTGVARDADTKYRPDLLMGPGLRTPADCPTQNCFAVRCENTANTLHAISYYHGLVQEDYNVGAARKRPTTLPAPVKAWVMFLQEFLIAQNGRPKYPGVFWGIPTYDRSTLVSKVYPAVKFGTDTNGFISFETDPLADLKIGQKIKLNVPRTRCLKGLAGMWQVIDLSPILASGTRQVTIKHKLCCNASTLVGVVGEIQLRKPVFETIDELVFDSFTRHKTGRAFFVEPGRRDHGCC